MSASTLAALFVALLAVGVPSAVWSLKPRQAPLEDLAPGLGDDGQRSPPRETARTPARLVVAGTVSFNDPRVLDFLAASEVRQ